VPEWLAEQVGPSGYVLASDIDITMLDETPDRHFDVRRHDLTEDAPPTGGFDLVHARLVLEHLPDPSVALTTLVAALRPEGWLLLESSDPKLQPLACPDGVEPAHALANKLRKALWDLMAQRTRLDLGRTLPRRLRDVGLADVNAEVAFDLGGSRARRMQHTLIAHARPALIAAGLADAGEIDRHLADLDATDLEIAVFPIVSAWGRKHSRRDTP
jgi:SAM-dependent methyltransferase